MKCSPFFGQKKRLEVPGRCTPACIHWISGACREELGLSPDWKFPIPEYINSFTPVIINGEIFSLKELSMIYQIDIHILIQRLKDGVPPDKLIFNFK